MSVFLEPFMLRALLAAAVTGLAAPAVGTYLVQRRLALLGDGIGHICVTGVALGLLPSILSLVAPIVLLQYVLLEVFAGTAYAKGRNTAVIAVVEAVLVGWAVALLSPLG